MHKHNLCLCALHSSMVMLHYRARGQIASARFLRHIHETFFSLHLFNLCHACHLFFCLFVCYFAPAIIDMANMWWQIVSREICSMKILCVQKNLCLYACAYPTKFYAFVVARGAADASGFFSFFFCHTLPMIFTYEFSRNQQIKYFLFEYNVIASKTITLHLTSSFSIAISRLLYKKFTKTYTLLMLNYKCGMHEWVQSQREMKPNRDKKLRKNWPTKQTIWAFYYWCITTGNNKWTGQTINVSSKKNKNLSDFSQEAPSFAI